MTLPEVNEERRPLDDLLNTVFDRLSDKIAGGRTHPNDLLPGAQDPLEGLVPDEFRPDLPMNDWFDPLVWARGNADISQLSPASGPGMGGKGADWFRTGEASNNFANRHNPLYQARREFSKQIAPKIEEMFGVSSQGSAGYLRQPHASHKAPGGPSGNSDHYSGGAIDFFGDKKELDALRDWLVTQPFTSFVRWQSESHYDHVHVSFDLGWVAQNFFTDRSLPPVSAATVNQGASVSAPALPDTPDTDLGAAGVGTRVTTGGGPQEF